MPELQEIIKQIEELRSSLIKAKKGRSYTDPEVIIASQELDAALDMYQDMMINYKNGVSAEISGSKTFLELEE